MAKITLRGSQEPEVRKPVIKRKPGVAPVTRTAAPSRAGGYQNAISAIVKGLDVSKRR